MDKIIIAGRLNVKGWHNKACEILDTGGGTEQQPLRLFQIWKSQQNGWVYDPDGISPCLNSGHHAGVEPKIIVYEDETEREYKTDNDLQSART